MLHFIYLMYITWLITLCIRHKSNTLCCLSSVWFEVSIFNIYLFKFGEIEHPVQLSHTYLLGVFFFCRRYLLTIQNINYVLSLINSRWFVFFNSSRRNLYTIFAVLSTDSQAAALQLKLQL